MKVVLFCGGLGMRLREYSEKIPKPMVTVGDRPILLNIMKYYAFFGHKEFILCLGYQAEVIKNYFLTYNKYLSNNFMFSDGGKNLQLMKSDISDISDWKITFVYTGMHSNIGQRLKAVEPYLDGDSMFLANYSDGLSDLPLPKMINHFDKQNKIASFICVKPVNSFHVVKLCGEDSISDICHLSKSGLWINGGYFIFRKDIFDYIKPGDELVDGPFNRLKKGNQLCAYKYEGFWISMDTFKDKQNLDDMYQRGETPWAVWKNGKQYVSINA